MKLENQFVVTAPIETVWAAITDPDVVAPCIPGFENAQVITPTLYKATIKVQVGPISARFVMDVQIADQSSPTHLLATVRGEEGSRASQLKADAELRLQALEPNLTQVDFGAEVQIVGRLGKFGLGVMKKKSQELSNQFTAAFKAKVEQGTPAAAEAQ